MNTITIAYKTGQVSTHRMAFMPFSDVVEKGKDMVAMSGSVVEVVVSNSDGDVATITKKGNTIVTTYDNIDI